MARRTRRYTKSRQGGPSWLMTGILMGLTVVVAMNWEVVRGYLNQFINTLEVPKLEASSQEAPTKTATKKSQSPEFDFYNMLGNQKVNNGAKPTPAQKSTTPAASSDTAEDASKQSEPYVIRIASLSSYEEADRFKAELTMMGFDVSIQAYQHNDKTWYRVNAGPYPSRAAAMAKQTELQQNNVIGVLVKQ